MFRLYSPSVRCTVARGATSICYHDSTTYIPCQYVSARTTRTKRQANRRAPAAYTFDLQRFAGAGSPARPELERYATVDATEMARLLDCHPQVLRRWARQGLVPVVRIGRSLRFRPAAVMAALEQGVTREAPGDE